MNMPMEDSPSAGAVKEFPLHWPGADGQPRPMVNSNPQMECCTPTSGSTHELVYDKRENVFWVSGQQYNHIARLELDGSAQYFSTDRPGQGGSMPHGIRFDLEGNLWVTLEGLGELARIDKSGQIVERVDVKLYAKGASQPLNTRPHGLGVAPDGSLWFTGKLTNTVGRVDADRQVSHFELPTLGAVPIYLSAGPDGNMWCTELGSGLIARITPEGEVTEFHIPTSNSRPIAIVPSPDGQAMWFSEEAGGKVCRIDLKGNMIEFPVPITSKNAILGGLGFDSQSRLWVQQYVSPPKEGSPVESDYIVRLSSDLLHAASGNLTGVSVDYFKAPSKGTVMHRISQGPDDAMWFSELWIDQIGRVPL
jgi:virginiamycin B lyase